jgi:hypothetical protein
MTLLVLLAAIAALTGQSGSAAAQADAKLIRVFVHTDDGGEASELAARRQSVKDLSAALGTRTKVLVLVLEEDRADVAIEVIERGLTVPKIVIGLGARPGQPPGGDVPARAVRLRARLDLVRGGDSEAFTNKNAPLESTRGWKSAADDIARQIEKWIADRRAMILAAR